jgi:hypothetical protein
MLKQRRSARRNIQHRLHLNGIGTGIDDRRKGEDHK